MKSESLGDFKKIMLRCCGRGCLARGNLKHNSARRLICFLRFVYDARMILRHNKIYGSGDKGHAWIKGITEVASCPYF